jgi:hypothetical protein
MKMGGRGMGELAHGQERVSRPSLALPRPILITKRREQHGPILALFSLLGHVVICVICVDHL